MRKQTSLANRTPVIIQLIRFFMVPLDEVSRLIMAEEQDQTATTSGESLMLIFLSL
jgi:hypothetical protein